MDRDKKYIFLITFFYLLLLSIPLTKVFAAGLAISDPGTKAMGRGGAFIANPTDLMALYYNPAGLANLNGINILLDCYFITTDYSYTKEPYGDIKYNTAYNTDVPRVIPNVAFSYNNRNSEFLKDFVFALGMYTPLGSHLSFPRESETRFMSYETSLTEIWIMGAIGYNIKNRLRLGVNLGNAIVGLEQSVSLPPVAPGVGDPTKEMIEGEIPAHISAYSYGNFTYAFGASFDLTERIKLGFSVIPKIETTLKGEGKIKLYPPLGNNGDTEGYGVTGAETGKDNLSIDVVLPWNIRGGISVMLTDKLETEFDVVYQKWSVVKESYVDLEENNFLNGNPLGYFPDIRIPQEYKDSMSYRFGLEYNINPWIIRTGYFFEENAVPNKDYMTFLVDGDKHVLTFGFSYLFDWWSFDISYAHMFFEDRNVTDGEIKKFGLPPDESSVINNGEYKIGINFVSAGLNFKF